MVQCPNRTHLREEFAKGGHEDAPKIRRAAPPIHLCLAAAADTETIIRSRGGCPREGQELMMEPESQLVLPFAVIEREGGVAEEFPLTMTLATILADVEKEREKAGMFRKREEGLEFVSILYWPIVVSPWAENRYLVFDGMGVWSYVFSQGRIPDARSFAGAVEAVKDYKSLLGLLNERATYFDSFTEVERIPIMGLFIHEEFMQDVLAHIALARPKQLRGNPFLTPRLSPEQSKSAVARMRAVVDAMTADIEALTIASRALDDALANARKELAGLRERTAAAYGKRIETIRPDVNARVAALEREREDRWIAMQPKLLDLQADVRKNEADLAAWEAESRRRDDLAAASQARARRDTTRHELERARSEVGRFQEEMAQTRANYDRQVQAQWERIREIERERDAELARLDQEEQGLVHLMGKLSQAIARLAQQLEGGVRFLESQGVPAAVSGPATVRMPIMVASLVSDRGRRMVVYPPMVARMGKGVLGGIRATFGGAVLPLEPKTKRFEELFRGGIEKALGEDASLAAYVASVGNSTNLLHLANLKDMLSQGLAEMKAQGWIRDKHERELIEALERHIAAASRTAPKGG